MKLGVLTVALGDMSLDAACKFLSEQGVQMVEIGCGGFPGTAHCNAAELLADENKQKEFLDTIHKYGLEISALSAHGNAVHPDKAIAGSRFAPISGPTASRSFNRLLVLYTQKPGCSSSAILCTLCAFAKATFSFQ